MHCSERLILTRGFTQNEVTTTCRNSFPIKMPMVGLEPTRPLGTLDFESSASASSATSASNSRERHDVLGILPRQARPFRLWQYLHEVHYPDGCWAFHIDRAALT